MNVLSKLWAELDDRFDLDTRLDGVKRWMTREDRKTQRRIALACGFFALALLVLAFTSCSGGPEIYP